MQENQKRGFVVSKSKRKSYSYRTTREKYKAAKVYDHQEFDAFCSDVYDEGYAAGVKSVPKTDLTQIMASIRTVKGIGEKRLQQIETALASI